LATLHTVINVTTHSTKKMTQSISLIGPNLHTDDNIATKSYLSPVGAEFDPAIKRYSLARWLAAVIGEHQPKEQ